MAVGCVRRLLGLAARAAESRPSFWTKPMSQPLTCSRRFLPSLWRAAPLCTAPEAPGEKKKKKHQADGTIVSVGRRISHRTLQLISESGEDMGVMHRVDVLKMLDSQGLKLVLLNESKEPAVYQLMSGRQIYAEQMKMREKQKERAGDQVQVKELVFSSTIGPHDLTTKLKQVESWLEKKSHVRLTLRCRKPAHKDNLCSTLAQMLQQIGVEFGFVLQPTVIREGKSATCVLRLPTKKELAKKAQAVQKKTPPAGGSDNTDGGVQQ